MAMKAGERVGPLSKKQYIHFQAKIYPSLTDSSPQEYIHHKVVWNIEKKWSITIVVTLTTVVFILILISVTTLSYVADHV